MFGENGASPTTTMTSKKSSKMKQLLSNSYSDSQPVSSPETAPVTWQAKFDEYINRTDELGEDKSIVAWWGVCALFSFQYLTTDLPKLNSQRLPVWAAIACDYLPIIASLISSE